MSQHVKKIKVLTGISVVLAATACSSPPTISMPSGNARISLNSRPVVIDEERQRLQERATIESENTLRREMSQLSAEIAHLKEMIYQQEQAKAAAMEQAVITAKPDSGVIEIKAAPLQAPKPRIDKAAAVNSSFNPPAETGGSIEILANSIIFRVSEKFAKTDFNPSPAFSSELLKAASSGKIIYIRGRTDATRSNPVDSGIAMMRAVNARTFLLNNGVAPDKIRVNYLSAGDNIADNSSSQGRALNRRVELEVYGVGKASFAPIEASTIASKT